MTQIVKGAAKLLQHYRGIVLVTAIMLLLHSLSAVAASQDQRPRNAFNSTCASCHDQNGVPTAVGKSLNAPDLGSAPVQKQTTAQLQQIIGFGKGNMPPFKAAFQRLRLVRLRLMSARFQRKEGEQVPNLRSMAQETGLTNEKIV